MKKFVVAAALFSASSAFALLPPFAQSKVELARLLESPELRAIVENGPIMKIEKNRDGYLVAGKRCQAQVNLVRDPMPHPGALKFHYEFPAQPDCSEKAE